MKQYILPTLICIFILLISLNVNAAMEPGPAFCQHMRYKMIGYSIGKYGTETIERFLIYYEGKAPEFEFQYNRIKYTDLKDIEGIRRHGIKWDNPQHYCVFDDGNKCQLYDFYDGKCGLEYRKEFPCRNQGKVVFSSFEKCCAGLESYLPYGAAGQSTCQPIRSSISRFFGKIWYYIWSILNFWRLF